MRTALLIVLAAISLAPVAHAQDVAPAAPSTTIPSTTPSTVDALRDQLKAAYQRGDVDGMLKFLHPQVVIVFPDGEVLQGRDALAKYYDGMLKAPGHVVESYTSDPQVSERYVHGSAVVSFGKMNDHYVLTDGTKFGLDSRFTITALKSPDGPPETDGWMIRSFHSSTDAFDNAVLGIAIRKVSLYAGIGGVVLGIVLGLLLGRLLRKRPEPPRP